MVVSKSRLEPQSRPLKWPVANGTGDCFNLKEGMEKKMETCNAGDI